MAAGSSRDQCEGGLEQAEDRNSEHRTDELMRSERALYSAITDNIPVLLCLWDPTLETFKFNKHLRDVLGWTEADAADGDFMAAVYPDPAYRQEVIQYMLSLESGWRDLKTTSKDGQVVDISWANIRLADGTSIGIGVDIRQRKLSEETLERANEQLESKVRERTAELSNLVSALQQEVRQRENAEQQLSIKASQLRALVGELTLAEQRERRRLGMILHDHLQQLLVGAKFKVAILERMGDEPSRQLSHEINRLLSESMDVSRSLTAELSPPILQEGGLEAGLEWLARWMLDRHALRVSLVRQSPLPNLPTDMTVLLFESLRELLFNTVKHARVSSATVVLCPFKDNYVHIQVRDEGQGFDPESIEPTSNIGGFGLFSIRERLNLIGGKMEILAAPGQGTSVLLTVPLEDVRKSDPSANPFPR
jgi:PAS domain S-box-containing protein